MAYQQKECTFAFQYIINTKKTLFMKVHNFSAGPAILVDAVIRQSAEGVRNLDGIGLSILEISHRSPEFVAIMNEAVQLVKELLDVPDNYEVLFLSGGASSQFFMSAMNLLGDNDKAYYINTGTWSKKAIKEAIGFGTVEVLASSEADKYNYIPKGFDIPADGKYLHITSNNTVAGTQYHEFPTTSMPIVCDMSSDIFSRPIDVSKFGIIYAGAQKNMGPAGTTLVIVNKDLLGKIDRKIPTMLDYRTHIDKGSMFNTPPVYPIYVSMLTLKWVKANGGIAAMEKRNIAKAQLIYDEIDNNPFFKGLTVKEDRSLMNVTFETTNPDDYDAFLKATTEANCSGVKGHRSVGGFRASIYNAMPIESVQALVNVMKKF